MTKRGIAALLAIIIVFLAVPLYAGAEDISSLLPALTVYGSSAAPGDTVSADVFISGNPGIYSFSLGFEYDTERLELLDVTVAPELGGQSRYSKKMVWVSGSRDVVYDGKLLEMVFAVKEDAPEGGAEITLTYSPGDICNYNEEIIDFLIVPGEITVSGGGIGHGGPGFADTIIYDPDIPLAADSELCVRLAGDDRIRTAAAVSAEGWDSSEKVIIANAFNYPDALAGASLSKLYDAPILLTGSQSIDAAVIEELKRLGAKNAVILGGPAAVSDEAAGVIAALGINVSRLYGSDRNGTAAAIARELGEGRTKSAYLVSNINFADALSVSPAAAVDGAPVLYVNPDGSIPAETADILSSSGFSQAFIIGGTAAVSLTAEENLSSMKIKSERISGEDRYMTSLAVCKRFGYKLSSGKAAIATGKNFPDALSGAAFAAKYGMPVILVGDSVPKQLKDYISLKQIGSLYAFGGTGALSDDVIDELIPCLKLDRTSAGGEPDKPDVFGWLFSCGGSGAR